MLNLGQRKAFERISHFFCEMVVRSKLAEQMVDDTVPMPLTQQEIGDALGLSNIHVNRITQELKETDGSAPRPAAGSGLEEASRGSGFRSDLPASDAGAETSA
jgi:hypothetical protein